jgi:hypothetical protein
VFGADTAGMLRGGRVPLDLLLVTFLRWLGEYHSTIVSVFAVLVSLSAFVVAFKSYKLNRQAAERSGSLKEILVTKLAAGTRYYSRGFRAINGPDELTITSALLRIDYHLVAEVGSSHSRRFIRYLRPTSFELLGIQSPELPVRLAPNDEIAWKLPPWRALDLPHEVTIEGITYAQCIHLQLEVTASGSTYSSNAIKAGRHVSVLRPYLTDITPDQSVEELLGDTQNSFFMRGQLMIGLHRWIKHLIETSAMDSRSIADFGRAS